MGPRVSLPVRGSLSVRAIFHNTPVNLPPLPSLSLQILSEHLYLSNRS